MNFVLISEVTQMTTEKKKSYTEFYFGIKKNSVSLFLALWFRAASALYNLQIL